MSACANLGAVKTRPAQFDFGHFMVAWLGEQKQLDSEKHRKSGPKKRGERAV